MSLPAAFLGVVLIWSTTPLAILWSAQGVGPSFGVFARMLVSVVLCFVVLWLAGVRMPLHARARTAYLVSGITMFGTMALTYWSAQYITSGMISVLYGLTPLITSLGAVLWLKEEALTPSKLVGILLGIAGLLLIFGDGLSLGHGALLGLAALLGGISLQALGLVWLKRIGDDSPPLATTMGSLTVGLPMFLLAWLIADGHLPHSWPMRAVGATIYLGAVGSVLGFALYYYLIKHLDAGRIALITLLTPVCALLLGHALNQEAVMPQVWLGAGCILLGLSVHRWGAQWLARLLS